MNWDPQALEPTSTTRKQERAFGWRTILNLCLRYWYVFALSFVLFGAVARLLVSRMITTQNEYYLQLLVPRTGSQKQPPLLGASDNTHATYTPSWKEETRVSPMWVQEVLNSSTVLFHAAQKADIDVFYYTKGLLFGRRDVYNQCPIKVNFLDALDVDNFSFFVSLKDLDKSTVTLSRFAGSYHGNTITTSNISVPLGSEVNTPVGRIKIEKDDPFNHFPVSMPSLRLSEIKVSKKPLTETVREYDSALQIQIGAESIDETAGINTPSLIRVDMAVRGSERKALELLNSMIVVLDSTLRDYQLASLAQQEKLMQEAIVSLDTNAIGSEQNNALLRKKLEANIQEARIEAVAVPTKQFVWLIDTPRIRQKGLPAIYVYIIALVLAMAFPLLLLYLWWTWRGCIEDRQELSPIWTQRFWVAMQGKRYRKKKDVGVFDELSLLIQQEQEAGKQLFVLTTPTHNAHQYAMLTGLQSGLEKSGRKVASVILKEPSNTLPKEAVSNVVISLEPGLLASKEFETKLEEIKKRFEVVLVQIPAANRSTTVYTTAHYADMMLVEVFAGSTKLRHLQELEHNLGMRQQLQRVPIRLVWVD